MSTGSDLTSQLPSIRLHSPLAIVGAFLFVVRERFKPGAGLPWTWHDNKAETDILIEVQYEKNSEAPEKRPGIYIDKDQTVYGQISLGNRDQNQPSILNHRLEHFISQGQSDLVIDCVSETKGESAQLADAVQQYLHMSNRIISQVFNFRSMSPIVAGRTVAFSREDDLFNTPLNFRVEYEIRWATLPAAPALQALAVHLGEKSQGVNTSLTDFYMKSTGR